VRLTFVGRLRPARLTSLDALDRDGALLRDFTTSYQMLRDERGRWRILSYIYHDE
jgi:hypothetical protein